MSIKNIKFILKRLQDMLTNYFKPLTHTSKAIFRHFMELDDLAK